MIEHEVPRRNSEIFGVLKNPEKSKEKGALIADAIVLRKGDVLDDLSSNLTWLVSYSNSEVVKPMQFMLDIVTMASQDPRINEQRPSIPQEDPESFKKIEDLQEELNDKADIGYRSGLTAEEAKKYEFTDDEYTLLAKAAVDFLLGEDHRALADTRSFLTSSLDQRCILLERIIDGGLERTFPRVSPSELEVLEKLKEEEGRGLGPDGRLPKDMRRLFDGGLVKKGFTMVVIGEKGNGLLERYKGGIQEEASVKTEY